MRFSFLVRDPSPFLIGLSALTFPLPDSVGKLTVLGTFLKTMAEINKAETEEKNREKIVVLSNFTQTLDVIEKHCIARKYPYCRLDGFVYA